MTPREALTRAVRRHLEDLRAAGHAHASASESLACPLCSKRLIEHLDLVGRSLSLV